MKKTFEYPIKEEGWDGSVKVYVKSRALRGPGIERIEISGKKDEKKDSVNIDFCATNDGYHSKTDIERVYYTSDLQSLLKEYEITDFKENKIEGLLKDEHEGHYFRHSHYSRDPKGTMQAEKEGSEWKITDNREINEEGRIPFYGARNFLNNSMKKTFSLIGIDAEKYLDWSLGDFKKSEQTHKVKIS